MRMTEGSARELEGARRVGMVTVAVDHDPAITADYYARSLPDLLNPDYLPAAKPVEPLARPDTGEWLKDL